MTAPAQDAISYARAIGETVRTSLRLHGHGACRHEDQGRYDYATTEVVCGCGHRVKLEGAQPGPAPVTVEREAWEATEPRDPVKATLAVIDPTMAYTPVDLEMRILDVLARLEQGAVFERHAHDDAARKQLAWKEAYWVAKNASEASAADKREADAMVQTMDLYRDHLQAEWVAKAVKATMHNLRSILSGYQSVAKSVVADFNAGGANR